MISRRLISPPQVRRITGTGLVGFVGLQRPAVVEAEAEEVVASGCPELADGVIDDFTGESLTFIPTSAFDIVTIDCGICGTTDKWLFHGYDTPPLLSGRMEINVSSDTFRLISTGTELLVGYSYYECALGDISSGGAINAIRLKVTEIDDLDGTYISVGAHVEDATQEYLDYVDLAAAMSILSTYGVVYIDIMFADMCSGTSPCVDPTDVKKIGVGIRIQKLAAIAVSISEASLVCSGRGSTSGISHDGAGGPNNGSC